ncbi:hypothetical protein [Flocculibacter collagenilyticus]|uniref:hypothetical protein n=1 Tax=Flocculibacter collagenilyticus TaxID=2744479 RepID=UPI0018F502FD|nr:hypothetical protein [Flocculibacter collagenilyticus]
MRYIIAVALAGTLSFTSLTPATAADNEPVPQRYTFTYDFENQQDGVTYYTDQARQEVHYQTVLDVLTRAYSMLNNLPNEGAYVLEPKEEPVSIPSASKANDTPVLDED